jgi:succinyl-CoA synthetase beta subunit
VLGLMPFQTRRLAKKLGLEPSVARPAAQVMNALYRIFTENDSSLVEINPLIITASDQVLALDAKMDLEDDALFRHEDLKALRDRSQEDTLEAEAADQDIAYVNLDGDVGCLVNGAGLAMATLDVTSAAGAAPANFLDVGGGATADKVTAAFKIMLCNPKVKAILVNIFGGIARGDEVAYGLVEARARQERHVPMVVRIVGTNADEAARILAESGDPDIQTALTFDEAVEKVVA